MYGKNLLTQKVDFFPIYVTQATKRNVLILNTDVYLGKFRYEKAEFVIFIQRNAIISHKYITCIRTNTRLI
jgi:hypothetical protein